MKTKGVFLFLLILLPVMIFLFLKFFGTNNYFIPLYYQSGVGDTLQQVSCIDRSAGQYAAQNPLLEKGGSKVIHFERMDGPVLKTRLEELEKVQDVFFDNPNVELTTYLNSNSIKNDAIQGYNKRVIFLDQFWKFKELDSTAWGNLKHCDLIMSDLDNRVVLLDTDNRIRGYYNIMEREETDRLIVELRILQLEEK